MTKDEIINEIEKEVDDIQRLFKLILADKIIQEFDYRISQLRSKIEVLKNLDVETVKRSELLRFCQTLEDNNIWPQNTTYEKVIDIHLQNLSNYSEAY